MALSELWVSNYRSLRDVRISLGPLTVVTGPNGCGKSNLYRSLRLITEISEGGFAQTLAREGGLLSAMWAGPRTNKKPLRMKFGFRNDDFSFELACGYPIPNATRFFSFDPEIKEEAIWYGESRRPSTTMVERKHAITWARDIDGDKIEFPLTLSENESVLAQLREPSRFPELYQIRDEIRKWRFYHGFETHPTARVRSAQTSVRTPVLGEDGSNLAAALATIIEIGDRHRLFQAIDSALPGRSLEILPNDENPRSKSPQRIELTVALFTEGCERPLLARELSDGTLKFLCLAAALLSPRPPELIALNEPETSIHNSLMPALARLIVDASSFSQVWVTTHSKSLIDEIRALSEVVPIELELVDGRTELKK